MAMIPMTQEDNDDDEDDDHRMVAGGPFENTKRKSSWSASSMRKELGSPRVVAHTTPGMFPFDSSSDNSNDSNVMTTTTTATITTALHATSTSTPTCPSAATEPRAAPSSDFKFPSRTTGPSLLQELGCALGSCSGASRTRTPAVLSPNWVLFKDSLHKVVKGDLGAAKDAWRRSYADEYSSSSSRDESILTNDYYNHTDSVFQGKQALAQEEAMQLRRLTSWGTVGTYETMESLTIHNHPYKNYVNAKATTPNDMASTTTATTTTTPEHHDNKTQTVKQAKKVVRFDYPPISSLRECPRTRPEQIGDLFFTEHELSTSTTAESDSNNGPPNLSPNPNPKSPSSVSNNSSELESSQFQNYVSTPAAQNGKHNNNCNQKRDSKKLWLRNFSFDEIANVGRHNSNTKPPQESYSPKKLPRKARRHSATLASSESMNTANSTELPSSPAAPNASRRIIKSVQIYLRERSTG
jgi:hypothetical protein